MWRHITDFHPDETTMQELLCYNHRTPEMQYFCRVPKVVLCDPRNHWPTRVRWDWTEDKTRELRDLCWCQSKCICDMRVLLNCLKWHRVSERWKWLRTAQDINQFSCSQRPKINLWRIERTRSNNFTTRIYRNRDEATRLWCCHRTCFDRVISVGPWTECCCILSQRSSNEIRTKVAISKQIKRTNGTVGRCRDDTIRGRNVL